MRNQFRRGISKQSMQKSLVLNCLKGQCHELFYFRFFSWISFPEAPEYIIRAVSNFFENLTCEYLSEFSKKCEMILMSFKGLGGKWFTKITWSKKSRDSVLFILIKQEKFSGILFITESVFSGLFNISFRDLYRFWHFRWFHMLNLARKVLTHFYRRVYRT